MLQRRDDLRVQGGLGDGTLEHRARADVGGGGLCAFAAASGFDQSLDAVSPVETFSEVASSLAKTAGGLVDPRRSAWTPARSTRTPASAHRLATAPVPVGETMKIEAMPGSGKTTAVREWCRGAPDEQILYLCYSKAMQEQQEKHAGQAVRGLPSSRREARLCIIWIPHLAANTLGPQGAPAISGCPTRSYFSSDALSLTCSLAIGEIFESVTSCAVAMTMSTSTCRATK